ncbi:MAG: hypothetical protein IJE45_01295 [Bacilli bacterium]|nr:hypothetical protein [Bacilli bacterium]
MEKKYTTVIFDIIDSRKIFDRYTTQLILKKSIEFLNESFGENIVKEVVTVRGDEFQGSFRSISAAFDYIRKLQLLIYPIRIRCGIGKGNLKYLDDDWTSVDIDGSAYHNSRNAIDKMPNKDTDLILFCTNSKWDVQINTIMIANSLLKRKQSAICRLIELIIEFLYPIGFEFKKNNIIFEEFWNILSIHIDHIEKKTYSLKSLEEGRYIKENKITFYGINKNVLENSYILSDEEYDRKNDKLYKDGGVPHGIIKLLSEIIGTSKQNISKHITLGNVKESRALDETILELLGQM